MTEVCGKRSQGTIVNEKAKRTAPKRAAPRDSRSSESQSHIPASAANNFTAAATLKAFASGSAIPRNVSGEKAADCPFAANGEPHAFHRLRHGSEPSFHASRTALAQGAIWVATSFRFGFAGGSWGSEFHGGRLIAWSTGKIVLPPTKAGRRNRIGRRRNARKIRIGRGRRSHDAARLRANAV